MVINGDCLTILETIEPVTCIFADPPDNIGLGYNKYNDKKDPDIYIAWLSKVTNLLVDKADITWISFNAKWIFGMGSIVRQMLKHRTDITIKPCVQVFTFGQHNNNDLGNCHRPLWRFMRKDAVLYPDNIRTKSWRQEHGDKRASPLGKVPGDVFDFPRVTGNSAQRRAWHPTQLHEELVERCILLSTKPGDKVIDPFGGTGTTLRVCQRLNRSCTIIEIDPYYCEMINNDQAAK